jgi:general secretion pathway protein F
MPAFKYEAIAASGAAASGLLEADSARAARNLLRARGLTPLDVQAVQEDEAARAGGLFARGRLSALERTLLTRQLASLLAAGLPLERALAALADEAEREQARALLAGIRSSVAGGSTLHAALRLNRRDFDELYCNIVAAGEESGQLAAVLAELADYLEGRQALRAKLVGALTYPAIVLAVSLLIVMLLLGYVVPQVVGVYANAKQKLPGLTLFMMAASGFLRAWWWALLAGAAGVWAGLRLARSTAAGALALDRFWLALPVLGRLVRGLNTARFASTLAILVNSGVPMLRALAAAGETLGNTVLKADVAEATALVREGASLANALALHKRFPPVLLMFIRLGEQTGQLPAMLRRAARQHADEVERRTQTLTSIVEPVMILAMGVLVLAIVLAVILPIVQLNALVK